MSSSSGMLRSAMAVEFAKGIKKSSCWLGIKSVVNNRKVYFLL